MRRMRRSSAAVLVTVVVVACIGTVAPASGAASKRAPKPCNGHVELCKLRLDQVTLAGAHNAYANAADGFVDVAQTLPVRAQLDAGVRALLLDVYQGTPTTDHVCTDPTPLKVQQLTREYGKQAVDSLVAIRDAQCPPADGPTSALYLCHGFCEEGAEPFADTLGEVRDFLGTNRREVLVLVLEDYAEAPDIERSFTDAGLAKHLVSKRPDAPWPTLAKMVASNRRLVVFSEKAGGAPPWFMPAFDEMQDTPYSFDTAAEFSCAVNRGPKHADLFVVNHWLGTDDATAALDAAATVNAMPVLLDRAEQCEQQRGRPVNLLVVEFVEVGDLVATVDALNDVAA